MKAARWHGRAGSPTKLILLRHGQTELSAQRRYSGRGNPPLTELGMGQAKAAATRLADEHIDAIVSSPLARALSTAEQVGAATGTSVSIDDGLIENDFGDWEGLTFPEAAERDPKIHADWWGDITVPAPGGESFAQTAQRVAATKAALLHAYAGKTVVVVSHVTPIKTLLQDALAVGPSLLFRLHLDLASISVAEFFPDGGSMVRHVNDIGHLTSVNA